MQRDRLLYMEREGVHRKTILNEEEVELRRLICKHREERCEILKVIHQQRFVIPKKSNKKIHKIPKLFMPGPGTYNPVISNNGYSAFIQPLPKKEQDELRCPSPTGSDAGDTIPERRSPQTARTIVKVTSDYYVVPSTFDPKVSTGPKYQINGSPRKQNSVVDIDLYVVSQRPGPGHYFPKLDRFGFAGRDRSMRRKTDLERFNCGLSSINLPDLARTPR